MKKVALTGTKNSVNTSFTLAEAPVSGGWVWIIHCNLLLARVASAPGVGQYTIAGTAVTCGTAPDATDGLFAFIQITALTTGLTRVALTGAKNTVNLVFTLPLAVPSNSHAVIILNGLFLEEVASAPDLTQFTITGQTITLGSAPGPRDELIAYIEQTVTIITAESTVTGTKDDRNLVFTGSYTAPTGQRPLALAVVSGLAITEERPIPGRVPYLYTILQRGAQLFYGAPVASGDDLSLFVYDEAALPAVGTTYLWQDECLPFTVMATAASLDAPAARVADRVNPTRAYRSPNRDAVDLICDFGEQRILRAIVLDHTNVLAVGIATSQDNSAYTDLATALYAISEDLTDHYRKTCLVADLGDFTEVATRYVRFRIHEQETSDGLPYYFLGMALFLESLHAQAANANVPLRFTLQQEMLRNRLGGRPEIAQGGPRYLTADWQQTLRLTEIETGFTALAALGEDTPFVLTMNDGDRSHVYYLQREEAFSFDLFHGHEEEQIRLRQVR